MWVGWLGTALWLLIAAFIVIPKWPELSVASPNTIGDTLAGFVAPLAFLWLIVATWLQRQELGLQRKELAESRQVLAGQQRELENTARENAEQTRIMQETLRTSQDQSLFEEHKLRLYYLAKYIQTQGRSQSLVLNDSNGNPLTIPIYDQAHVRSIGENITEVDGLLVDFASRQENIRQMILGGHAATGEGHQARNAKFLELARYIQTEAEVLGRSDKYLDNPLVAARLQGIEYEWILENIRATVRVLHARPL
jgi:hypothetical protein